MTRVNVNDEKNTYAPAGRSAPGERHRVVIIGGGFGGLAAAMEVRKGDVDVTVLDRTNHHLFQPLRGPFTYRDPGSMAALGRGHAIVSFRGLRYGGFFGFLSWLFVHLALLTGFRSRAGALIAWSWAFIGRSRNQRAFTVESIGGSEIYGQQTPEGSSNALSHDRQ